MAIGVYLRSVTRKSQGMDITVEEARRVRRLGEVFVLERSTQGGGVSDLS